MSTRQSHNERAAIAVREFGKMLPSISAFAKALTGNPRLRVEMGAQSATDSRVIMIRPPLALAESRYHEPGFCDVRDGYQLVCPACQRMEEVYAAVYHEIAHHLGKSLVELPVAELAEVVATAAVGHGTPEYIEWVTERARRIAGSKHPASIYEFAGMISNHLLNFVRAVDDVRIDALAGEARPGVEEMRYYQTEKIIAEGVETDDGGFDPWIERGVETQVAFAIMIYRQGHELDGAVDPRIIQMLELPQFAELMAQPLPDPQAVLGNTVALLGECNKLGLYELPVPPPPMPAPPDSGGDDGSQQKGEPSDDDGTGDSGNGSGAGSSDPSSADPDSGAADSDPGDSGDSAEADAENTGNQGGHSAGGAANA